MGRADTVAAFAPGSVVLHVGLPKTATSTLQRSVEASREALAADGAVPLWSDGRNNHLAFQLAAEGSRTSSELLAPMSDALGTPGARRFLLSAEVISRFQRAQIRRVLDRLPGEQVQVVVTLRSIAGLIGSNWQERVKAGREESFEDFVPRVLEDPSLLDTDRATRPDADGSLTFERWAELVGPENVTVVVLPPSDRGYVLRTFEALLGAQAGVMTGEDVNASLSWDQIEFVRALNGRLTHLGNRVERSNLVREGVCLALMQQPEGREAAGPSITLPGSAAAEVQRAACAYADRIRATGVNVIGDLDVLASASACVSDGPLPSPAVVSVETAAHALAGLVRRAERRLSPAEDAPIYTALPPAHIEGTLSSASPRWVSRHLRRRAAPRALVHVALPETIGGLVTSAVLRLPWDGRGSLHVGNAAAPVGSQPHLTRGSQSYFGGEDAWRLRSHEIRELIDSLPRERTALVSVPHPQVALTRMWWKSILAGSSVDWADFVSMHLDPSNASRLPEGLGAAPRVLADWAEAVGAERVVVQVEQVATPRDVTAQLSSLLGLMDEAPVVFSVPARDLRLPTSAQLELLHRAQRLLKGSISDAHREQVLIAGAAEAVLRNESGQAMPCALLSDACASRLRELDAELERTLRELEANGATVVTAGKADAASCDQWSEDIPVKEAIDALAGAAHVVTGHIAVATG
ncbi:hypothetical protein [Demequina salsinemoris]|uniref:hypothetical protein n=1 Tax=Demequina salsinemoris TaxID=577470 RepID=UPI0007827041|nr:hypothetical protein [Demequina salsinemoris]